MKVCLFTIACVCVLASCQTLDSTPKPAPIGLLSEQHKAADDSGAVAPPVLAPQAQVPHDVEALDEYVGVVIPMANTYLVYLKRAELNDPDPRKKLNFYDAVQPGVTPAGETMTQRFAMWGTFDVGNKQVAIKEACDGGKNNPTCDACKYSQQAALTRLLSKWGDAGFEIATMELVNRQYEVENKAAQDNARFLRDAYHWIRLDFDEARVEEIIGKKGLENITDEFHKRMQQSLQTRFDDPRRYEQKKSEFVHEVAAKIAAEERSGWARERGTPFTDELYRFAKYWLGYIDGKVTRWQLELALGPKALEIFDRELERVKKVRRDKAKGRDFLAIDDFIKELRKKAEAYEIARNGMSDIKIGAWYIDRDVGASSDIAPERLKAITLAILKRPETGHYVHSAFYDKLPMCPSWNFCLTEKIHVCEVYPAPLPPQEDGLF